MIVTDADLPYLVAQRGGLDELKAAPERWLEAYEDSLWRDLGDLAPFLPDRCDWLLDVGAGLGGIDALINRHYEGAANVVLLDGAAEPAAVVAHGKPFSAMAPAAAFLAANGLARERFHYMTPDLRSTPGVGLEPFDLVVSLQAWCFHFAPETYLDAVLRLCRPGTVLVLDVRNGRADWRERLEAMLRPIGVARTALKFTRSAYVVP